MTDWFGNFLKTQDNQLIKNKEVISKEDTSDKEANTTNSDNIDDLIKTIKDYRIKQAKSKGLPLYCIFSNATIDEIITYLPTNKTQLANIKGFGKKTIENYGEEIILFVNSFLEKNPNYEAKNIPIKETNKTSKINLPKIVKTEEKEIEFIDDENTIKIKELISNGENLFITGSAGTGKSFILNKLKKEFKIEVTSTTGMAAVNIGGQTIHAWAGVGICNLPIDFAVKNIIKKSNLVKRIRNAKLLAIDEISMLDAQTFDYISTVLKAIRANNKAFGGLQLILFGDFFQLPPVEKGSGFCFESQAWKELNLKNIILKKIYRQSDNYFAQVLDSIRQNNLKTDDLNAFYERNNIDIPKNKEILHIFATNETADKFNTQKFNELLHPVQEIIAKDIIMKNEEADKLITKNEEIEALSIARRKIWDTLDKYCKVPFILSLKKECRVMLLKNLDFDNGLINGACGKIETITEDGISVQFDNGILKTIKKEEFDYIKDGKLLARRIQYPLRLAYGITIHKSQGMTLDNVFIDFNRIFEYGQAYVALSRVKSLNGLYLRGFNPQKVMASPKIIEFYKSLE